MIYEFIKKTSARILGAWAKDAEGKQPKPKRIKGDPLADTFEHYRNTW